MRFDGGRAEMAIGTSGKFVSFDDEIDIGLVDIEGYAKAPIRLEEGHAGAGNNHATDERIKQLLTHGFNSFKEFSYYVAKNYTEVRKDGDRLVVDIPFKEGKRAKALVVELQLDKSGDYYTIITGMIMRDGFYKKKELVAEVVRAEQQALSGVGSTFNPMADKTTVIGQAPVVATSKNTTTTNLTKQQVNEDDRTNIGINSDNADIRQLAAAVGKYTGRGDADIREAGQLDDSAALEAVSRAFGKRVVVFESFGRDTWFQGAVLENNAEAIYISANSTEPAMAVLGHEMMHKIRAESPVLYKQAIDAVRPLFNEQAEARMTEINEQSERDSGLSMSRNELEEEMLADVFGDNFMDQSFWAAVARNMDAQNKGAFGKFIAKVRAFLRDAFARLSPYGTDKMLTDVQAAQDALAQVAAMHLSAKAGNKGNADKLSEMAAQFSVTTDKPTQAVIAQAQRDLDKQLAVADKLAAEYGYLTAPNGERSNCNGQVFSERI